MNQQVNFTAQQAVGRLVPQPQYSFYSELITNGYQNIDTRIFTDMQTLDIHFYQIMYILQDGIELPSIQNSVIFVRFTDNEQVKLSIFDYWFNLLFWGLPVSSGKFIDSRYLWFYEDITQDSISEYINTKFLKENRRMYDNITLNNMIDDIMYKFQFIDKFSLYLYNTANNEDTIELMKKNKEFYDCIHCDLSKTPIEDVKDVGMKYTKRGIELIKQSKFHWAIPSFRAKEGINIKQYREFQFNIGTVPDGNGGVYPYIINGNFANRGINNLIYYFEEAGKGRLAQVLSHQNVGTSGAFARILGLNNTDDRLYPDMNYICDSKHFVKIYIKDAKTLSMYKRRWFRFTPNGIEYQISMEPLKDNADLIGKTLLFRSPITCASRSRGQGICWRCYGELANTNYDINIGKIAAEILSSLLTQRLLSAKHLLETNIKKLHWSEYFSSFFEIDYSNIRLKEDTEWKKWKMVLEPLEDDDIEDDELDSAIQFNKYVTSVTIVSPRGETYVIGTKDEDNMYISPELSIMLNKRTPDEDGLYSIDMDLLRDKNLFIIEVINNELGRTLEKIQAILNKNGEIKQLKTKDAVTQALVDTVIEGGLNIDAIHLEVILSHQCKSVESNLVEPEWWYPNANYRMITLNEALRDNKSITVSLMYKDTKKLLFYPLSFIKCDPSVLDLFFMTHPQNYMSMKPTKSNLVEDKEEGPIKPFTIFDGMTEEEYRKKNQ